MNTSGETTILYPGDLTQNLAGDGGSVTGWDATVAMVGLALDEENTIMKQVQDAYPDLKFAAYPDNIALTEEMTALQIDAVIGIPRTQDDVNQYAQLSLSYRQTSGETLTTILIPSDEHATSITPLDGWIVLPQKFNISLAAERLTKALSCLLDQRSREIAEGEATLTGSLRDNTLNNVLTYLGNQNASGILGLLTLNGSGRISFLNGHAISAQFGSTLGEMAMPYALMARTGRFHFIPRDPALMEQTTQRTISKQLNMLIIDALRTVDEVTASDENYSSGSNTFRSITDDRIDLIHHETQAVLKSFRGLITQSRFQWNAEPLICTENGLWDTARPMHPKTDAVVTLWCIVETVTIKQWLQNARISSAFELAMSMIGQRIMGYTFAGHHGNTTLKICCVDEWPITLSHEQEGPDILVYQGSRTWHNRKRPHDDVTNLRLLLDQFSPKMVIGVGNGDVRTANRELKNEGYGQTFRRIDHNLNQIPLELGRLIATILQATRKIKVPTSAPLA